MFLLGLCSVMATVTVDIGFCAIMTGIAISPGVAMIHGETVPTNVNRTPTIG